MVKLIFITRKGLDWKGMERKGVERKGLEWNGKERNGFFKQILEWRKIENEKDKSRD
ncbi:MAG: hypothetical protein ABIJ08_05930 [Nanoarchaeota archaeon]